MSQSEKPRHITFRNPELQALGKQLARDGEIKRKEQEKINSNLPTQYWPDSKEYFVWSRGDDADEFWKGVELWLQYLYDFKSPDVMPLKPLNARGDQTRYRYFYILSRRYNSKDFRVEFNEI